MNIETAASSSPGTASTPILISVQQDDFRIEDACRQLRDQAAGGADGALVTFTGLVRNNTTENLISLQLEHYPGMTERALNRISLDAVARWPLGGISIIHRVGTLSVGSQIVFCAVLSAHRQGAFEACHYLMDALKTEAPFWKKEICTDGSRWVEARSSDEDARARWGTG